MAAPYTLIVDTEEDMGRMLVDGLRELGWEASATTRMVEALAWVEGRRCTAVVSEIRVEDGDGFALLRAVREGANPVPVILMSCFGSEQTSREALAAGAFAYLTKPFEVDQLLSLLERAHATR